MGMVFLGLVGITCFWSHAARHEVALKAALAAEFRCHQAGWRLWRSCRGQYNSQVSSAPKAARCYAGQCLMALWHSHPRGGLPQHLHMGSCLDSCPKPSPQVPLLPRGGRFRQLRSDGSFRQELLQLLILSVLFPRLSHRADKKNLLFLVTVQAVPLSQQLPRSCTLSLAGLILSSLATARETSLLPHGREEGKREWKKV